MSRRYLLFVGDHYYPGGGAWDLIGDFDDLEEAKSRGTKVNEWTEDWVDDWANILDVETMVVLRRHGTSTDCAWIEEPLNEQR